MLHRKLYLAFVPVLAAAAFAVAPAVASAAEWYSNGVKIGTAKVAITTMSHGTMKLEDTFTGEYTEGNVSDSGNIWNEGGVGKDEVTSFTTANNTGNVCAAGETTEVVVEHSGAPLSSTNVLPTELNEVGGVVHDRITGIEVIVKCNGATKATFTGELNPTAVNGTAGSLAGCEATPIEDSYLGFEGSATGELSGPFGTPGIVEGQDCAWGPEGDEVITAE